MDVSSEEYWKVPCRGGDPLVANGLAMFVKSNIYIYISSAHPQSNSSKK